MNQRQISGTLIRDAVREVLKSGEPASTREVVTAVYYRTGNDRVSYTNVRRPVPYDVVQVRPGHNTSDRDLSSVRLTVHAVSDDGSELDATEYTGGPLLHFAASSVLLVSPPRGSW